MGFVSKTTITQRLKRRFAATSQAAMAAKTSADEAVRKAGTLTASEPVVAAVVTAIQDAAATVAAAANAQVRSDNARGIVDGVDYEAMAAYLRQSADLQISKAGALRTYCALLAGVAAVIVNNKLLVGFWWASVLGLALMAAVTAAAVPILTSWTSWPKKDNVDTPPAKAECNWLVGLLWFRGNTSNIAVLAALLSTCLLFAAAAGIAKDALDVSSYLQGRP